MRLRIPRYCFTLLLSFLPAFPVSAQTLPFRTYNAENGFAQLTAFAIFQDSRGYLWIGTYGGGVSRFDGLEFQTFTISSGLADDVVSAICEDRDGNIWIGTGGGLSKYDGERFISLKTDDGLVSNVVSALCQDVQGRIWIGTSNGVSRYDGNQFTSYRQSDGLAARNISTLLYDSRGLLWIGGFGGVTVMEGGRIINHPATVALAGLNILEIVEDSAGRLWFGTEKDGAYCYDGRNLTRFTVADGLASNTVSALAEDAAGALWFGSLGNGVSRYDGSRFSIYTTASGLGHDLVRSIFQDREGNMWFGTGGGISRLRSLYFRTYTSHDGLAHDEIESICEERNGSLWFGTWDTGISRFQDGRFTSYSTADGLPDNSVRAIALDSADNLWLGTRNGLCRYNGRAFTTYNTAGMLTNSNIHALLVDSLGTIWIGSQGRGLHIFDGKAIRRLELDDGVSIFGVRDIEQGTNGELWIGGDGMGVYRFDGTHFAKYTEADGLAHMHVRDICRDDRGILWFATLGGVSRFDGQQFTTFTTQDGLSSDFCEFILQDGDFLYIGTRNGVNRFNPETGQCSVFTVTEGLASNKCNAGAAWKDRQGRLWFGTIAGATVFNPARYSPNTVAPPVHFTGLQVMGVERSMKQEPTLSFKENNITIGYIGLCLTTPELVRYRYRLSGLDDAWIMTDRRSVSFTHVPPGRYTFEVQARNNDGYWSETPAAWHFVIHPPLWATGWFRFGALMVVVAGIIGAHRLRTRIYKKHNWELERAIDARTRELRITKAVIESSRDELEIRVRDRTEQLYRTIDQLQAEILDRQEAERKILELNRFRENIIDNANTWLTAFDRDGNILLWNKAAEAITGYKKEDVLGHDKVWEWMFPDPVYRRSEQAKLFDYLNNKENPKDFESILRCKNDEEKVLSRQARILYDARDLPMGLLVLGHDVTSRKLAEQQLADYQKQLQSLASQLTLTEEQHRRNIASNLHDQLAQTLQFTKLKLQIFRETLQSTDQNRDIQDIIEMVNQGIGDTRALIHELSPTILYELGFVAAIEWLAEHMQDMHRIPVTFSNDSAPKPLDKKLEVILYAAVRELLINVVKHAEARSAQVRITRENDWMYISVADDGVGFDVEKMTMTLHKNSGFGYFSIRERLQPFAGRINAVSTPGAGTTVTLTAPLLHETLTGESLT